MISIEVGSFIDCGSPVVTETDARRRSRSRAAERSFERRERPIGGGNLRWILGSATATFVLKGHRLGLVGPRRGEEVPLVEGVLASRS